MTSPPAPTHVAVDIAVEVAVDSVAGVRTARTAGADRVELCAGLGLGGLTPSLALVESAVAAADGLPVLVLLRPTTGGFVHDADDAAQVVRDADLVLRAGASGVVVGPVTGAGQVDVAVLRRLHDVVADRGALVFHRAVDVVDDLEAAIEVLVGLGVDRVLTSGGAARAGDGMPRIDRALRAAAGRLAVMAGGGVRPEDIAALTDAGLHDVHLSGRVLVAPDAGFGATYRTDGAVVAAAVAAARRVG